MERYASSLKMKEIKRLAQDKQYLKAMKILGSMNVDKIRNMSDLSVIAEILIRNDEYEDAMEILLRIYEKSCTRRIVEQLIDLSIKMKNMEETKEFYNEYLRIAPRDPYRLVLRYKIEKANHTPYVQRIITLEQLKQEDYMEEWAYELAKLYHKTGQVDKCVDECSDIILWFGQGIVVEKARLLKEHYTSGFNITDNLGAGEFDATRSLEEVIKQVKRQRGVIKPANLVSDCTELAEVKMEPLVKEVVEESKSVERESTLEEVQPIYQEKQPETEKSSAISLESNYVLTPDIVKEVKARVNVLNNPVMEVKECEQEPVKAEDKPQEYAREYSGEERSAYLQQIEETTIGDKAKTEAEIKTEVIKAQVVEAERDLGNKLDSIERYDSQQDMPAEEPQKLNEVDTKEDKLLEEESLPEEEKQPVEEKSIAKDSEEVREEPKKELTEGLTEEASVTAELKETQDTEVVGVLTEEELQKMKERMQQLHEYEVAKTYRHDSHDIYEDGENTYAYGINLNTIFQNFIKNESIKQQLLSILENMDNSKRSNNFMVCGEVQTGKTSLARAIAIAMWKLDRIPTKKVAKISASKLNQINLIEKMEQLADGSVVIENASLLNSGTVKSIIQMIEHFDGRILVLFEDTTRNMEELMMREEELRTFFTHRIIIPRYNAQDITEFAYSMVKQQEYKVEEEAREYFADKIEQICRVTPNTEQLTKVKVYVGELIKKAETRNMFIIMKQAKEGKFSQKVTNVITIDDIID